MFPIVGASLADTKCAPGPLSEYERLCHDAAAAANVLAITRRVSCMWKDMGLFTPPSQPCFMWNHLHGYRQSCCAHELHRACQAAGATGQALGWPLSCAGNTSSSQHWDSATGPQLAAAKVVTHGAARAQFRAQDRPGTR
jgi:hypothetical protein